MTDTSYRFRTALGGFHKGDVTGYIEKTAAQHRSELLEREQTITALREENRSLQQQLNLLMMATPVTEAPQPEPKPEPEPIPVSTPEPTPAATIKEENISTLELQAYRRAEATERLANNRAKKLYMELETMCADALDEFEAADTAAKQTVEAILTQAAAVEKAYLDLSAALNASREKLAAMDAMIPDPGEDTEL